jgi:hypothetical protein
MKLAAAANIAVIRDKIGHRQWWTLAHVARTVVD